jgi:K(+)-stimulated pyrophosphate-energized sodium pump
MPVQILVALASGLVALIFATYLALGRVMRADAGNETMVDISHSIHEGAMAFLTKEYRAIGIFVILLAIVISFGIHSSEAPGSVGFVTGLGWKTAIAFVFGALCSVSAGFIGMQIATRANSRTAQAATRGFNPALGVAFPGGAVMGMCVAGIGLAGVSLAFYIFGLTANLHGAANIIAGFSMGASSIALFARVGGGIYTKAADVGADLVGKIEAGIPEDDPRNPATIADNVGDNVGDVAGMGADLFESYVGTVVSAIVIAVLTPIDEVRAISYAFLVAAVGIFASILGVFFVRVREGGNPQLALRAGTVAAAVLFSLGTLAVTFGLYRDLHWQDAVGSHGPWGLFLSIFSGLVAGMVVGFVAEFYTSGKSVAAIAESSRTGVATNIIAGFATGMKSTVLPLVVIGGSILLSYSLAGFFGIALAAIGMLGITGMTVAVDAYGPIADNAGGIAEMSHLPKEVRKVTDSLDAAGNTTAAIAKGFAIGSAALTALALFTAFVQATHIRPQEFNITNVNVLAGLMVGGIVPFLFAADTMRAVGRAAFSVVNEVRRQFREIPGLMEGKAKAEYARCVSITTEAALKEMIGPGVLAVAIPLTVGILFGVETLGGLLAGALISGVPLALMLANAGGAWDNAKKHIEGGELKDESGVVLGKGSDPHKAAVVGDTVGDPFKDTSGPAMNILLKLMAIVSLVFAPAIMALHGKLF